MAEYLCPCGCGRRINVTRACCRTAWDRLPPPLQRRFNATRSGEMFNPGMRRAAFEAVADWLRANREVSGG